jgi:hypothetical protein
VFRRWLIYGGSVAAALGFLSALLWPSPARGDMPYRQDFEGEVGSEWSVGRTEMTPAGGRHFLGQFGNDAVRLALQELPEHATVTLSFDLYVIRTWDGSGENGWGPDVWRVGVDGGPTLMETSFSYPGCWINRQAYPGTYGINYYTGGTGAAEMDTLGYTWRFPDGEYPLDAVYRFHFTFPHTGDSLALNFSATGLQELFDESWGLDNVRVETRSAAAGRLAVSPLRLDFGTARPGATRSRSLTLRNSGRAPLTVDTSVLFAPYSVAGGGTLTLAPGERRKVTVVFHPTTRGFVPDLLVLTSDDPRRSRLAVPVTGRGR